MINLYNHRVFLIILLSAVSLVKGGVSTEFFLADSNYPVEYQEIMIGTQISFLISSDTVIPDWKGGLALLGDSVDKALLSNGQALEAAGDWPLVNPLENVGIRGYRLYIGIWGTQPGDWFIVDYTATEIGDCNVAFFDYEPTEPYVPTYNIEFTHVPTRDFDGNAKVDFSDFGLLASNWNRSESEDPNFCQTVDIDSSGTIDINDLMLFSQYWLERTK